MSELAPQEEIRTESPRATHDKWVETAKAGLFAGLGVAQGGVGTAFLIRSAQIRMGIENAFSIVEQMGITISPESIQEISNAAARLPELAAASLFVSAACFFGISSAQAFRTARRFK